jgi:hypothetical protein
MPLRFRKKRKLNLASLAIKKGGGLTFFNAFSLRIKDF